MRPETGYATLGDQSIAYQLIGDGPVDIVTVLGARAPFDVEWGEPNVRAWYRQLDGVARNVRFDPRGVGASDPLPPEPPPPWEALADEIESVLDAIGTERAIILAGGNGGPAGALFATTRPTRTSGLIFFQTAVRWLIDDDYPFGLTEAELDSQLERIGREWGTDALVEFFFPSRIGDPDFGEFLAKHERATTSPSEVQRRMAAETRADARALLSAIRVPTLVLHRTDSPAYPREHGRYIAQHIDGAELVELPGGDAGPYWEYPELAIAAIKDFLARTQAVRRPDRRLATVVFTDIVDSTRRAEQLGDQHWQALLDRHHEIATQVVEDHEGSTIRSTGDGILATFTGPGRAISGAASLQRQLRPLDLEIRTGIHSGEIESSSGDVGGIAVHLAARILDLAGPGEILVSRTVKDLVVGSDLVFSDRGVHSLKGFDEPWQLYAVVA